MARAGFYNYADAVVGVDGVIYKEPLTSFPLAYTTETGAGVHTYSAAGFTGTPTAGLAVIGAPDQSKLAVEGSLSFKCSKAAFSGLLEDIPVANENFLVMQGGDQLNFNVAGGAPVEWGNGYIRTVVGGTGCYGHHTSAEQRFFGNANGWEVDSLGHVQVDITWDTSGLDVWLDKGMCISVRFPETGLRCLFTTIALNSANTSGGNYTWRNLIVAYHKFIIPTSSRETNIIHVYGNSYTAQSQYPPHDSNNRQRYSQDGVGTYGVTVTTEDGKSGTGYTAVTNLMDAAMFPVIHRQLAKHNLFTNRIHFWGHGGAGIEAVGADLTNTVATRVTTALSGPYPIPDVAIVVSGYNDAALNGGSGPADLAAYELAWNAMIDEIIAASPDVKIVICNQPYNTDALFFPTLLSTQNVNSIADNVSKTYSQVTLVDMLNAFGGYTGDGTRFWRPDRVHPDDEGQALYGVSVANAIAGAV